MRVGFDLDGVLYDFGNSVLRYLSSIGKEYNWKNGANEPHNWNFYEYWNMDLDEFKQICHDGVDAGYIFSGPARPNAAEAVNRVADLGHEIVIVTDRFFGTRPDYSHVATKEWLAEHLIPWDELVFSPDKCCVQTDMFVEDKLQNYDALVDNGVDTYLINRPWNEVKGGDTRQRILDILDYAEAVERATVNGFVDLSIS